MSVCHPDIWRGVFGRVQCHFAEQAARKRNFSPLKSSDPGFLRSSFGAALQQGRNLNAQGSLLKNGCLLAEQSNQRLKNADNRFFLTVSTVREGAKGFFSTWKVDSIYDFEPFSVGYFINIPLAEGYVLKLPDGLSHHLTTIGVASDFSYTASWTERWTG